MAKQRRPPRKTTKSLPAVRTATGPRIARLRITPADADAYFEAVAVYERGVEALQRHDYPRPSACSSPVLRQYPDEKELHERVRLYLNICARQATPREDDAADDRRAALRRRPWPSTAAATTRPSRTSASSATRTPTTTTRSTCSRSRMPSAANWPKPSPISSARSH